jgi:arylsulfatase A-like enzyme
LAATSTACSAAIIDDGPAEIASGVSTGALVSSVDIAATFVELAHGDGKKPAKRSFPSERKSFAEVLIDPAHSHRSVAFAEDHWHDYEDHARCVATQRFKLIRNDYVDLPSTPSADAGRGLSW